MMTASRIELADTNAGACIIIELEPAHPRFPSTAAAWLAMSGHGFEATRPLTLADIEALRDWLSAALAQRPEA